MSDLMTLAGAHVTKTSLTLIDSLSQPDWEKIGEQLTLMEGAVQWWIGDWLNFGEKTYGETYRAAAISTGYDDGYLQNLASVARKVESSHRCEDLKWTHHREIAALEPEQQVEMLAHARNGKLSVRDLRDKVKQTYQPQLVEEAERIAQEQTRLESLFRQPVSVRWLGGDRKSFFTVQLKFEDAPEVEALANNLNKQMGII